MKKNYFLLLCFLTSISFGQNLIITGVIDGPLTGGIPKAVELYVANDIADLSIYGLGSANNGGGSDGQEFTFPADAATAGSFIYVASEDTAFSAFFGFAPDYTDSAANINGDDAIEIFMSGAVIDVFGDIDTDGTGEPWEHLDGWAYRNDNTGPDGSTFVLANWSFSGPNALDNETTNASAATPFPIGTYGGGSGVITIENPVAFEATAASVSHIDLSWALNNDSDNVMVASTQGAAVGGNPEDGTSYPVGAILTGGGTIIYAGNSTSFDHAGLVEDTFYGYKIWSVDGNVNYSTGVATDAQTQSSAPTTPSDLIISGVMDGPLSGGVPKVIELFVINDIADLSIYGFGSANNGGGTDGEEFTFPAEAASAGDFIYVASETTGFNTFFGFDPDFTSSAASINGDDAIELFLNGNVVDVFGDINVDGNGTPWEYLDGWAYRNDNTGPDGSAFVLANWTFSGPNALDGETSNANTTSPFPIGTYGKPALIITGVIDGPLSGGIPKAVELYAVKDIADLSIFGIGSANNGGGTDGEEFPFPANAVSKGDFIYVASESVQFSNFFGFAPDHTSSAANINGDDAIELFMEGQVIDVFGDINVDGNGTPWEYMDGWAYRNNGTGPDGSTFVLANWSFSGPNALDGETTNATATTPFPIGTYDGGPIIILPDAITILEARNADEGELVTVSGILTVSDQFSGSAYLQDATGGIAIFDELVHGDGVFMIGDSITITGTRSAFNDQIQISPVALVENNGIPNQAILPLGITLSELANHPAELVRIVDPIFPAPGDMLFGNSNYLLTDLSGNGELRIDNDVEEIVGLGQPEACTEIIGVVGRFFETYQLLPRMGSDMSCAGPYESPFEEIDVPKDKTLDVATWNIEWFGDESNSPPAGDPNSDAIQKDAAKTVLAELNADIYAVEEISDDALFAQMVSELPGYDYILSPAVSRPNDPGVKQKVGFIYNTATVNVLSTKVLLESIHPLYNGGDDSALVGYPSSTDRFYATGRLPFLMTADITIDGQTEEYNIVALHARANSGTDAQNRYDMRKYDVEVLKDSLDVHYANANVILMGDYNDDVDVTVADVSTTISTYDEYVMDMTNYDIVTDALSQAGLRSFVFRENMIDHIGISNELNDNYIDQSALVHYEFYDSDYASTASDHFPVSARFQLKELALANTSSTNATCNGEADGTATISVTGGITPYTYEWSDGQTTATAAGLAAGTYNVIVTDALDNTITEVFTITEPNLLVVTTTENTTVYLGYAPESCTVIGVTSIGGGTAPFSFDWSSGETTETLEVCPEETTTFIITVTDANGCTVSSEIIVEVIDVACGNNPRNPKVEICHNGNTICVSPSAVQAHLNHGDELGSCDSANQLVISKVHAYPNPFKNHVNIKFNTSSTADVEFLIYNFRSTLVKRYNQNVLSGNSEVPMSLESLRKGLYFLKVRINGEVKRTRILIKN
ncbi:MAG: T9SS type A sorting domain-containing protein [Aureibaculum sp.]|nr:T9SS type A sorting domain-containing protein [Aureibaculum sp.]